MMPRHPNRELFVRNEIALKMQENAQNNEQTEYLNMQNRPASPKTFGNQFSFLDFGAQNVNFAYSQSYNVVEHLRLLQIVFIIV